MSKTTFTAKQLEEAIKSLASLNTTFPDFPIIVGPQDRYEPENAVWEEDTFPITFKKIGDDENVTVTVKDFFGGEEGGDHRMYAVYQVGWGENARYFEINGEYNSWDTSYWDGTLHEVVEEKIEKTVWVTKK